MNAWGRVQDINIWRKTTHQVHQREKKEKKIFEKTTHRVHHREVSRFFGYHWPCPVSPLTIIFLLFLFISIYFLSHFLSISIYFLSCWMFAMFSYFIFLGDFKLSVVTLDVISFVCIPSICIVVLQGNAILDVVIIHIATAMPLENWTGVTNCNKLLATKVWMKGLFIDDVITHLETVVGNLLARLLLPCKQDC